VASPTCDFQGEPVLPSGSFTWFNGARTPEIRPLNPTIASDVTV